MGLGVGASTTVRPFLPKNEFPGVQCPATPELASLMLLVCASPAPSLCHLRHFAHRLGAGEGCRGRDVTPSPWCPWSSASFSAAPVTHVARLGVLHVSTADAKRRSLSCTSSTGIAGPGGGANRECAIPKATGHRRTSSCTRALAPPDPKISDPPEGPGLYGARRSMTSLLLSPKSFCQCPWKPNEA